MPDSPDVETYFTGLAATYSAHRPSYPRDAIESAIDGLARPVAAADVGCGTGISTRLLAGAGVEAIGVDPNADMLAEARAAGSPTDRPIEYRLGHAEATGLGDASVDLVLCAQAFHWFDRDRALPELRRILEDHGRLALIWNVRDAADAFGAGYESVVHRAQANAVERGRVTSRSHSVRPDGTGHFTLVRTARFANPHRLDRAGLLGRARSASYFPPAGPLRDELDAELLRLFDEHQRGGFVVLEQHTELTLADCAQHP